MERWKRDVIIGIIFEVCCVIAFVTSYSIPVGTMGNIKSAQPGVYLRLWIGVFAFLTLVMIINAIWKRDLTKLAPMFQFQTVFTLALLAAYIYVMKTIGFLISTIVFSGVIILEYSWAAGKFKNEDGTAKKGIALYKTILFYILIAVLISAATEFVFRNLLNVLLPTWSL